jgi:hypothetical protein
MHVDWDDLGRPLKAGTYISDRYVVRVEVNESDIDMWKKNSALKRHLVYYDALEETGKVYNLGD